MLTSGGKRVSWDIAADATTNNNPPITSTLGFYVTLTAELADDISLRHIILFFNFIKFTNPDPNPYPNRNPNPNLHISESPNLNPCYSNATLHSFCRYFVDAPLLFQVSGLSLGLGVRVKDET